MSGCNDQPDSITDRPDLIIEQIRITPEPGKIQIGGVVCCAACRTVMAFAHDNACAPMKFCHGEGWTMRSGIWYCPDCAWKAYHPNQERTDAKRP